MTEKRLTKEIAILSRDGEWGTASAGVTVTSNIWDLVLFGPMDTPYEGGKFAVEITIPTTYPFQPPGIVFKTRIYHPNINEQGEVCNATVQHWTPSLTIYKVVQSLIEILKNPNVNDPLVADIADLLKTNEPLYTETARMWTLEFAV